MRGESNYSIKHAGIQRMDIKAKIKVKTCFSLAYSFSLIKICFWNTHFISERSGQALQFWNRQNSLCLKNIFMLKIQYMYFRVPGLKKENNWIFLCFIFPVIKGCTKRLLTDRSPRSPYVPQCPLQCTG